MWGGWVCEGVGGVWGGIWPAGAGGGRRGGGGALDLMAYPSSGVTAPVQNRHGATGRVHVR